MNATSREVVNQQVCNNLRSGLRLARGRIKSKLQKLAKGRLSANQRKAIQEILSLLKLEDSLGQMLGGD